VALTLLGVLAWGNVSGTAAAAPPVQNTAAYAPGSLGYFSVPAFNYVPAFYGNRYYGFGNNLVAPNYNPYVYWADYPALEVEYGYPFNNTGYPPFSTGYSPALGPTGWGLSPMSETMEVVPPPRSEFADITVQVPPDAEVWIEGVRTKQMGPVRDFVSPPLDPGVNYDYEIRATWKNNGEVVSDTQHVNVRAGDRTKITFRVGSPIRINPDKLMPEMDEEDEEP
jgi:uncharacterized protein (TIGR03000 family)